MKRTLALLTAAVALVSLGAFATPPAEKASDKAASGKSCCAAKGDTAAAKADAAGEHCAAAKGAGKVDCGAATKTAVSLTGKVVCEHCDLHKASSCNPVFVAEGREGYLPFCPEMKDVTAIKDAGDHGKVVLTVKGTLCKTKDGKEMLQVDSFVKKAA